MKPIKHFKLSNSFLSFSSANVKLLIVAPILMGALLTGGCSAFSVYKIDLPQGTPVTQSIAQQIKIGMNKNQVVYLVGSPAIRDTLAPNRWDYIYDYTPGTYGKREGLEKVQNADQHLVIYFDNKGLVSKIDGVETLPTKRH